MITPIKRFARIKKEYAQSMVEFALVFPIILVITYGLIEFGRMMLINAEVYSAAREGSRYGASFSNYSNCDGILESTQQLLILISDDDVTIDIEYDHGPSTPVYVLCDSNNIYVGPEELHLRDRVVVTVNVFYRPIIGDFLGIHGFNIDTTNYRTLLVDISIEEP
jgi:hypothetical protein